MPVAGIDILKEIQLVTKGAVVSVVSNPRADLWEKLPDTGNGGDELMALLIRKWNFTDGEGKELEITPANCHLALSVLDIVKVESELGIDKLLMSYGKKNS